MCLVDLELKLELHGSGDKCRRISRGGSYLEMDLEVNLKKYRRVKQGTLKPPGGWRGKGDLGGCEIIQSEL